MTTINHKDWYLDIDKDTALKILEQLKHARSAELSSEPPRVYKTSVVRTNWFSYLFVMSLLIGLAILVFSTLKSCVVLFERTPTANEPEHMRTSVKLEEMGKQQSSNVGGITEFIPPHEIWTEWERESKQGTEGNAIAERDKQGRVEAAKREHEWELERGKLATDIATLQQRVLDTEGERQQMEAMLRGLIQQRKEDAERHIAEIAELRQITNEMATKLMDTQRERARESERRRDFSADIAALQRTIEKNDARNMELIKYIAEQQRHLTATPNAPLPYTPIPPKPFSIHRTLIDAAVNGSLRDVEYHVKQGTDPNTTTTDGRNSLHYAAQKNPKVEVLAYLILIGCDINAQARNGKTPLDLAGSKATAEFLQNNGAKRSSDL